MFNLLNERPAFVKIVENQQQNYDDYILQVDLTHCCVNIKNSIKEGNAVDKEIRYTILEDDGENIKYEKAVLDVVDTSRNQVNAYRDRIEAIKAHIVEENEEIKQLEANIAELENVVAIADEKREQEIKEQETQEIATDDDSEEVVE